jgi:hypothetical protein
MEPQSKNRTTRKTKSKVNYLAQAKKDLKYWQKQLRLMDWQIDVEMIYNFKDMDGAIALNKHHPSYQIAHIQLLHPDHNPPGGDPLVCVDMEVNLVHELLHTRLMYCVEPSDKTDWHLEMSIETIARALVSNRRGISPEELI